jgi:hydroxyacylglutathione hydrolase
MLQVKSFTFNPFQENTYIIYKDSLCWIVDPGMFDVKEEQVLYDFINSHNLRPQAIINTHGHIDHVYGVDSVKQKYNIEFGVHEADEPIVRNAANSAAMFGLPFLVSPKPDFWIEAGVLQLHDEEVLVKHVPGHSPGSVAYYYPQGNWVIGGDVLFQGSVGRTDLPGGDTDTLLHSIKTELYILPDETIVYSGHGAPTTIGDEKWSNPFVRA